MKVSMDGSFHLHFICGEGNIVKIRERNPVYVPGGLVSPILIN